MPELPEVHTIVEDLKKYSIGATIIEARVQKDYKKIDNKDKFVSEVENNNIINAHRIAKNITLELNNNKTILIHLAMTGKLLLRSPNFEQDPWERVKFTLEKNGQTFELRYCDMRMFGKVEILKTDDVKKLQNKYGPEPLDETLTVDVFYIQIKTKKTTIKNALLDQKVISGMGNVYINDALWIAQIHPETQTREIDHNSAEKLLEASREILSEGIQNRGISMSDYVDLLGKKGTQQDNFRVYNQETCQRCNSDIEFIKMNNRGTYFCPTCQIKNKTKRLI